MKNRAPAKRVEKISAWRGRDGGRGGGRGEEGREGGREGVDEAHPTEKKRTEKEKPERGGRGGDKKSNLFVI